MRRRATMLGLLVFAAAMVQAAAGAAGSTDEAAAGPGDWQETLDRVAPAVVVLRVSSPRAFDDVTPGTSTATGFVIDEEAGLILTNRHVVTPGPVVAEAVFQNNEEVEVQAIYRDPVHDFGLFRYDPEKVRFIEPGELELAPDRARVGTEIRVVGNDAGEKLSILQGTIARLDRDAPSYGATGFNDFNTFYIQAASGTSGGSSGSPVIDIHGRVVALNAGGKRMAASSFYLPLHRVKRAVERIQAGEPVTRGTVQVVFGYEPFDEVRRLGLRPGTEVAVRGGFPSGTGMIVVREVVPGGPADGALKVGDVIVRIDGDLVDSFLPIEARLDDSVGGKLVFAIERGGEPLTVEVPVGDLHAISPSSYLEYGGGVLNPLSYHQARNASVPIDGVYVASAGYALGRSGVPRRAVITEVGGEPTPTLDRLEAILAREPHDARLLVRFFRLDQPRTERLAVLRHDRRWFSMRRCRRDDATGSWPCAEWPAPPEAPPPSIGETSFDKSGSFAVRRVVPSLVMVEASIPYRLDGVHGDRFLGAGLIVDAEQGLVVVDRETVPVALADLTLTFSGSLEVPGELVYLHPEHNLAVLRYDPERIGATPVREAKIRDVDLDVGDAVWMVGLTATERVTSRRSRIARREPMQLPLTQPPRFRDRNIEIATLADSAQSVGGVLTDRLGRVVAFWASFSPNGGGGSEGFFGGIPGRHLLRMVEPLRNAEPVDWHALGLEFEPLTLAAARDRGLSDERARRLERRDPEGRRVLSVVRRSAGSPGEALFRPGDLVLSLDGEPVTRFRDLRTISRGGRFEMEILRDREVQRLQVTPEPMTGRGTTHAVLWAGALLQEPHPALASQYGIPSEGVYVSRHWYGAPATRYRLEATSRILAVDGRPIRDLDSFLDAVAHKQDREAVRLELVDLDGKPDVITLKVDLAYWPTYELRQTEGSWERIDVSDRRALARILDSRVTAARVTAARADAAGRPSQSPGR